MDVIYKLLQKIRLMTTSNTPEFTNSLIKETSPYLQQHAHNPVDWLPWSSEALAKAKSEDKLIIISIGYSACHWCHVMEHESFEDVQVAKLMNKHFISIKVDREERPDVDNVYMDALHLMGQQGGWPLNCIALPDGRPVYGGTYFPKENWISILTQLHNIYSSDKANMQEYADKLSAGLDQQNHLQLNQSGIRLDKTDLDLMVEKWSKRFDLDWGGAEGAPKFPMPNSLSFLLRYHYFNRSDEVKKYLEVTLDKMADGGIYDHLGGGFARYSVDAYWKVPHFEKMLYDNAQLISLYSEGYKLFRKEKYKRVVHETIAFLERELTADDGGYYSALDADSEEVEGLFYIWTWEELKALLGDNFDAFAVYYNISRIGNWENGVNILHRTVGVETVMERTGLGKQEISQIITASKEILFNARTNRIRPGTDTKVITAWNALALSAFAIAYRTFKDDNILNKAKVLAKYLEEEVVMDDFVVNRVKTTEGKYLNGFLDDYALLAQSYIDYYQATFEEKWLLQARHITERALELFFNEESSMFQYTAKNNDVLFSTKYELTDNVIPGSNSVIANVLHALGLYFSNTEWLKISLKMLEKVADNMLEYGNYYSNWGILACQKLHNWPEIVFTGPDADKQFEKYDARFGYGFVAIAHNSENGIALTKNRLQTDKTLIYVCKNGVCQLPMNTLDEALRLLEPVD